MLAVQEQLKIAYEELGMTPEQIAADQGLDIVAVKSALLQCSEKYKLDTKKDESLDFTDDDLRVANKALADAVRYSEDEYLKTSIAKYIRNDKKGRLEVATSNKGPIINVFQFNERLQRVRQKLMGNGQQVIDVQTG